MVAAGPGDGPFFVRGSHSTTVPFELLDHHIYVAAEVDGKPVRMIVDTGGVDMLTPAAAKRLGITPAVTIPGAAMGTGGQRMDLGIVRAHALTLGGLTLARPLLYVIDPGSLRDAESLEFDGLVGFDLLSLLAVRIDYDTRTLTLTEPATFSRPPDAIGVPFEFADRTPIVHGAIDGIPATFAIDTGAANSLTTTAHFTREHHLVDRYHPSVQTITGWGVGGPSRSWVTRVHDVRVGDAVIRDVVTDLFTGDEGAFADMDASANLGTGILKRFIVTFDYKAKVLYLEPGKEVARRDVYDRSGMTLVRDRAGFRVAAVLPQGPAAAAGIQEGDRIVAIDGAPATGRPLFEVEDLFCDASPGTLVRLRVATSHDPHEAHDLSLTLAELVP